MSAYRLLMQFIKQIHKYIPSDAETAEESTKSIVSSGFGNSQIPFPTGQIPEPDQSQASEQTSNIHLQKGERHHWQQQDVRNEEMQTSAGENVDATIDESRRRSRRAATAQRSRLWPSAVIPYVIPSTFSNKAMKNMVSAMRKWESNTCLSFVEREPHHQSYLFFTVLPCGCCSSVGRKSTSGPQNVSIASGCESEGTIMHELGHAIGFWHEHSRPDRDAHVEVIEENIIPEDKYNFEMLTPTDVNSLGEPYDYNSIMHYGRRNFAIPGKAETLRPRRDGPNIQIGNRVRLSDGDVRQTNLLYGCPRKCILINHS
ncbi:hypothetical protein AAHC03_026965 [Spirometra sp. Aus1]